ncbi:MAG TPA: substrate-binding domain-containing protein [Actinomycetota bacterium]|nr:substrate-binding domain-containing protein [Actinomycetota bacterium]
MALPMRSMAARAVVVALLAVVLAACTSHPKAKPAASPSGPALSGSLRIAADSALQAAFNNLVTGFVSAHRGLTVTPTYLGSQALAATLQRGTTADVVAVASGTGGFVDALTTAGLVVSGTAKPVARDPLQIAVPAGNPQGLTTLAALTGRGVQVALVEPSLPLGSAAQQALALAGVRLAKPTLELTAGSVIADVVSGTAQAGLVAASDVAAGGSSVTGVALPAADAVVTGYSIAAVGSAANPSAASAFIAYVLSPAGQQILQSAGFLPAS